MQKTRETRLKIVKRKSEDKTSLSFYGELSIYTVGKLKGVLQSILKESGAIIIELTGVHKMDSAGMQILLSMHRECSENCKAFEIAALGEDAGRLFNLYRIKV